MSTQTNNKPKRTRGKSKKKAEQETRPVIESTTKEYFEKVNNHPEFQKRLSVLMRAEVKAKGIKEEAETKVIQLSSEIIKGDPYIKGEPQLSEYTLEAAEDATAMPTDGELDFKRKAYQKVAATPYKVNSEYREAAAEYYSYLKPILKGIETEFRNSLKGEALAEQEYLQTKAYWRGRQHELEGMITAFFQATHDTHRRTGSNPVRLDGKGTGYMNYSYPVYDHIDADDLAQLLIDEYKEKQIP